MAASRCILVGGLKRFFSHYFKYIGTLKTIGGRRWWEAMTLYSNLFRTKEKPGGKRGCRFREFLLYKLNILSKKTKQF